MGKHFDAFISYKHAPLDISIAERVQKSLEHYKLPAAIRKKSGKKKIERVFRDKDDLSITSDLSEIISDALENSDKLIVICSPRSKESIWVKREIRFFLEKHSRKDILTVLAEGEPYDAIPDELLSEEKTITDEDGNEHKVKVALEPLSCDYRLPAKRAKKEELPRLVSAIVGCSYDELMNRQRSYRMRRMALVFTAALAAAIAFGTYMYISMKKIDENYRESLANQSRYLAKESEQLLGDHKRVEAIQLALAALPESEDDKRPVTGEAMRALSDAVYAYETVNGSSIKAVWNYSVPSMVDSFELSKDAHYLEMTDTFGRAYVFDTVTHDMLFTFDDNYHNAYFTDDDGLAVMSYTSIRVYDPSNGDVIWEKSGEDVQGISPVTICKDPGKIYVYSSYASYTSIRAYESGNGDMTEYRLPETPSGNLIYVTEFAVSPDGNHIAAYYDDEQQYYAVILDTKTGETVNVGPFESELTCIDFAGNDNVMLSQMDEERQGGSYDAEYYVIMSPGNTFVHCLDAKTGEEKWQQSLENNLTNRTVGFMYLPGVNEILFYKGNVAASYDLETGEETWHYNLNDLIVDVSDLNEDGMPLFITMNGGMSLPAPSLGKDAISVSYDLPDEIVSAEVNNGAYILRKNTMEVIAFNSGICDEEWECTDEDFVLSTQYPTYSMCSDHLVIATGDYDASVINVIDTSTNKLIMKESLGSSFSIYDNLKVLGEDGDLIYVVFRMEAKEILISIDTKACKIDKTELETSSQAGRGTSADYNGKGIAYIGNSPDGITAMYYRDLKTGDTDMYEIDNGSTVDNLKAVALGDSGYFMLISTKGLGDFIIDTSKKTITKVEHPDDWDITAFVVSDASDSMIAMCCENRVDIIDFKGKPVKSLECSGRRITFMSFFGADPDGEEDTFLVGTDDADLTRYDVSTWEFQGNTDISIYMNYYDQGTMQYDAKSSKMYLQFGWMTCIIDTDLWFEMESIPRSLGYNMNSDRFFAVSGGSSMFRVGFFRHYTVDDLKKKAEEILGGHTISDEMKSQYGLS